MLARSFCDCGRQDQTCRSFALPLFHLLVIVVSIVIVSGTGCSRRAAEHAQTRSAKPALLPPAEQIRKIYAYSLIPGGVGNAAAFAAYRVSDRVLMEHFRDMGAKVFSTSLARDKWMYASYRVADAVYWTKGRVLVHSGERLLTDGNTLVRGRCGNRLSESPETPVQKVQPPAVTTDTFTTDTFPTEIAEVAPPDLVPQIDVPALPGFPDVTPLAPVEVGGPYAPAPPIDTGGEVLPVPLPAPTPPDNGGPVFAPPPFVPITGPTVPGRPYIPPKGVATIPTPEMSTWTLMLSGLFCLAGVLMKRRLSYRR